MEHTHTHYRSTTALAVALAVNIVIFLTQLWGGLQSDSMAVLSNAGHLLTDLGGMGLALYAARIEQAPPNSRHTYGYRRGGIVAALINAFILEVIALGFMFGGIWRLVHPVAVASGAMVLWSLVAIGLNLIPAALLLRHSRDNLNAGSIFWHILGDILGSLSIIVAALLIARTGWYGFDPLSAIFIGLMVAYAGFGIARSSVNILMEGTPKGHDPARISSAMMEAPEVMEVHHLHLWTIAPHYHALSAHIRLKNITVREGQSVIARLETILRNQFGIGHVTLQLETDEHQQAENCLEVIPNRNVR